MNEAFDPPKERHLCTCRSHGDERKTDHFDPKVGGAGNEKLA